MSAKKCARCNGVGSYLITDSKAPAKSVECESCGGSGRRGDEMALRDRFAAGVSEALVGKGASADKAVRRANVKASAYVTSEKGSDVKHMEPALKVDNKEILLISKSDAMNLIDDLRKLLRKMI